MKKLSILPIAIAGLGAMTMSAPAFSAIEFDQDVTPNVIYGSGNSNGAFTTDRRNGIELGLRAKIPYSGVTHSNGDGTYSYSLAEMAACNFSWHPYSCWNFDWTVNTDFDASSGLLLDALTYELGIDTDPGLGVSFFTTDPITPPALFDHSFGDNFTANGGGEEAYIAPNVLDAGLYSSLLTTKHVLQQSWRHQFFPVAYDPSVPGTYAVYLLAKDGDGNVVARTDIQVLIGDAPPVVQPTVDVVSYDMPNGSYGGGIAGIYADNTYDGAGNVGAACDPLTGGTGELTDGTIATAAYADPNWVGWASTTLDDGNYPGCPDPTIDFKFLSAAAFEKVTIHAWDAGGFGGIVYPASITVTVGSNAPRVFPLAGDVSGVDSLELPLGGDVGDTVSVAFVHGGKWLFLTEVSFNGYVFQPVAADDTATLTEEDPATPIYVLANDDDDGGPAMSIASVDTTGTIGSVVITNDGADLTYEPAADYCNDGSPYDTFTYTLAPGGSTATVNVEVTCVNDKPSLTLGDDENVGEDTGSHTVPAFASASPGGGADEAEQTFTYNVIGYTNAWLFVTGPAIDSTGQLTYTLAPNANGASTVTVSVTDSGGTLNGGIDTSEADSFDIVVAPDNDLPEVYSITPAAQTADYSDDIGTVTIVVIDIDNSLTNLSESNEPPLSETGLALTFDNCVLDAGLSPNPAEIGSLCTWTYDGNIKDPGDGVWGILFTPSDGQAGTITGTHTLTVEAEDASVKLDENNPIDLKVETEGDPSGAFSLWFTAWETSDPEDFPHDGTALPGDLNEMVPYMDLVPVGPGGPEPGICYFDPDHDAPLAFGGYAEVAYFKCDFDAVPVNTYEIDAGVYGGYYSGMDEGVFVVYDPSLGFTTGGGFFYWPDTEVPLDACLEYECAEFGTTECLVFSDVCAVPDPCAGYIGDKTNFGFNFKYNKKQKSVQGSLLMMRHTCEDLTWKVKSNAIDGLGLGTAVDSGGPYGWAAVSGKATFRDPSEENSGGNAFLFYVEDHGEQGCGQGVFDEIWIEVDAPNVWTDPLGPDPAVEFPTDPEDGDALQIFCGNIVVPHETGGKGRPEK